MKISIGLIGVVALVIAGCTSESTNPAAVVSYLATKLGTYMLNNNQILVMNQSGADSVAASFTDSTAYSGTSSAADSEGMTKSAALYVAHQLGAPTDTLYLSEDGAKLYRLFDLSFNLPNISPLELGTRWVLIGDQNNSTWTGLKDTVSGISVVYQGLPLTIDAVFDLVGTKVGNENITIGGQTTKAMHYKLDYKINFTITAIIGTVPVDPLVIPIDFWVVEGVGIVKTYQKPAILRLGAPANQDIEIPGIQFEATKYVKAS